MQTFPSIPDLSNLERASYSLPKGMKLEIKELSGKHGVSDTMVVAVFLRWAIDAWKKGQRP